MTMRSWLFPLVLTLTLSACASTTHVQTTTPLDASAGWALAPLSNHSETPLAGERAQGTLLTLLHRHGVISPSTSSCNPGAHGVNLRCGTEHERAQFTRQARGPS